MSAKNIVIILVVKIFMNLKLVSAIFYEILVFHQMIVL